mmetsp:Transcript_113283/g.231853  ORF Transcript_113283/g.231853 Transcript_113283/m.231853 type:complete len:82 (-) Transcript_113283:1936-2181(-)
MVVETTMVVEEANTIRINIMAATTIMEIDSKENKNGGRLFLLMTTMTMTLYTILQEAVVLVDSLTRYKSNEGISVLWLCNC